MENHKLKYDVHSIDGKLLLAAGAKTDRATLIDLAKSQGVKERQSYCFAELSGLQDDLINFMNSYPYSGIFNNPIETNDLLFLLGKTPILTPVIDSLEYFKNNDFHTYRHSLMVFALSTLIIKNMYPDNQHASLLSSLAGPSHDLGKTCIPLEILQKKTPLTRRELEILKHHVVAGYVQLSCYTGNPDHLSACIARDHHERRDGSGYPRCIDLYDEIVEIIILTDIYDALVSPRPYRPISYENRSALDELTRMAQQGKIGWEILKVLISLNRNNRPQYQDCIVSSDQRTVPPANNLYGVLAMLNEEMFNSTGSFKASYTQNVSL